MVFLQHMGYHKLVWYREIMNTHCHLMALLGRQSCSRTTMKPVIMATHKIIVCSPTTLDIWFTWKQQVIAVALAIKVDKTKVKLRLAAGSCGKKNLLHPACESLEYQPHLTRTTRMWSITATVQPRGTPETPYVMQFRHSVHALNEFMARDTVRHHAVAEM